MGGNQAAVRSNIALQAERSAYIPFRALATRPVPLLGGRVIAHEIGG